MEIFNIIAGIASILSLLLSLLIANKVYHIDNSINTSNNIKQHAKGNNNKQTGNING